MKPAFKITGLHKDGERLSSKNYKYEINKFPGGELHIKLNEDMLEPISDGVEEYLIYIRGLPKSSEDIMELVSLKNAIDNLMLQRTRTLRPEMVLELCYLPYGRQDRISVKGEENGVQVIGSVINLLNFDRVVLYDPHSYVPLSLIKNSIEYYPLNEIEKLMGVEDNKDKKSKIAIIIPDNGATKRLMNNFGDEYPTLIQFTKERNPETGKLTNTKSYELQENYEDVEDFYIIDDICDGGRTFIEIAKVFRAKYKGKAKLHLIVTNGIFSKGKEVLYEYFDSVQAVFDWTKEDNER